MRMGRIEGKIPSQKERLNRPDNWFKILLLSNFKISIGILLGPTVFRALGGKVIFWISVLSTGFIKKELMSKSGMKLWNLLVENWL